MLYKQNLNSQVYSVLSKLDFCLAIVKFLFIACFFVSCSKIDTIDVSFSNIDGSKSPVIKVEKALTKTDRSFGLMYRKKMPENQGMLFVFPKEDIKSFWMKNTYLPLDIIYISSSKKVVSIIKNAIPLTAVSRPSLAPAKYVVEVNAGLSNNWNVVPGSVLVGDLPEALE